MSVTLLALVALGFMSSCVRLGYDVSYFPPKPDASIAPITIDAGRQPADIRDSSVAMDAAAADSGSAGRDAGQAVGGTGYSNSGAGGAGGGGMAGSGGMAGREGVAGSLSAGSDAGVLVDGGQTVVGISGFYSGTWNELLLREIDGEIWGAYNTNNGTLVGTITGDGVFKGWLSETPSRLFNAGEVEFRWSSTSATVSSLDGRWRWGTDGSWVDDWDFVRVTDRQPPYELTERFDDPSDFRRHP